MCNYCDFHFSVSLRRKDEMLEALLRELEERKGYLKGEPVTTLYFGGGTPTVYAPAELDRIIRKVKDLFGVEAFTEVTVEANPDDLTAAYLDEVVRTDVSRLSIGVQSFDDAHLRFFNRRHDGKTAFEAVKRAKEAGFANLTIDLIYGVPGMSLQQWERNLELFFRLEIPHLSAYHLTIEPRTIFGRMARQKRLTAVPDRTSVLHYECLERRLAAAGYRHYEISNFALPGSEAVHNSGYWQGVPYLGVGPSAHSYDGTERSWNVRSNPAYLRGVFGGEDYRERELLTPTDRFNEYLMTGLRTARGVDAARIERVFGAQKLFELRRSATGFFRQGLLREEEGRIFIPTEHFLLSDHIVSALFRLGDC